MVASTAFPVCPRRAGLKASLPSLALAQVGQIALRKPEP